MLIKNSQAIQKSLQIASSASLLNTWFMLGRARPRGGVRHPTGHSFTGGLNGSPSFIRKVKRSSRFLWSQVKLLESSWFTLGSETFVELKGEVDAPVRQEPTYIKININIKLSNANKIVMLSQTHGYNQFVRFPKTVKSNNIAGSF